MIPDDILFRFLMEARACRYLYRKHVEEVLRGRFESVGLEWTPADMERVAGLLEAIRVQLLTG